MLNAIHGQKNWAAAEGESKDVIEKLKAMNPIGAVDLVEIQSTTR